MTSHPTSVNATVRSDEEVADLLLDSENPRLAEPQSDQMQLLAELYFRESLEELALSLQKNGYFEEEPLVTVRDQDNRLVVVEGNRRLATLKLLLEPTLIERIGGDIYEWPTLSRAEADRLRRVPTVRYPSRESVAPYLGFRHITGARTWKPLQKSRFISNLVEGGRTLEEVQGLIGDPQKSAAKRMYQSYVLYNQIKNDLEQPPLEQITENYSLLETMMGSRNIKRYVGAPSGLPSERLARLIDDDHLDELERVVQWIFGDTDGEPPVISESREIKSKLGSVVANEAALRTLIETNDLEQAFSVVAPEEGLVASRIERLSSRLSTLIPEIVEHSDDPSVQAALDILQRTLNAAVSIISNDGNR